MIPKGSKGDLNGHSFLDLLAYNRLQYLARYRVADHAQTISKGFVRKEYTAAMKRSYSERKATLFRCSTFDHADRVDCNNNYHKV